MGGNARVEQPDQPQSLVLTIVVSSPLYLRMSCDYISARSRESKSPMLKSAVLFAAAFLFASPALADGPIPVTLKNHRFTPSVIHVKAGVPNVIVLTNDDDTADEFDSTSLKVEKVVAGHSSGNVRLRPLSPGRYPFMGEYHSDTAQGVVIAE